MSVQFIQYACAGYYLEYKSLIKVLEDKYSSDEIEELFDKYHDSSFQSKITEVNGFSMIVDGMNGQYIFFGKIFDKSEQYYPLEIFRFKPISKKLKDNLNEEFKKIFGYEETNKIQHLVFTHFS